jgi:hypothetical protein
MMTYTQFKDYLARFVWRDGDTAFESDLDLLIKMGETRLNRDLRIQRQIESATIPVDNLNVSLPNDYAEARTVALSGPETPLTLVSPRELQDRRSVAPARFQRVYAIIGRQIGLVGVETDSSRDLLLSYYARVPDFQDTDESWLADEYLDLYTYAVLRHTASYLRDDERVGLWQNEYIETLQSVMAEEQNRRFAGSPMVSKLPGIVA